MTHEDRIARIREAYHEAHQRFVARLTSVPADTAERPAPDGGWSLARIAWHVAAVDSAFAALISGERQAPPLPEGFVERTWDEIGRSTPAKLEAGGAVVPPADVRIADALASLAASAAKLDAALQALTPERGSSLGVTHKAVGTVNLYQVGEWATVHTIRHNAQAKRVLGSGLQAAGPVSPSPAGQ
jgi:uncharacterized damage-inducible protein DinB